MESPTQSSRRCPRTWAIWPVIFVACGRFGQEAPEAAASFAEDSVISGVVAENVTACEVDAACYLRIEFADTTVVALYGTGERPAPPCEMSVEVSDTAFRVQPGEVGGCDLTLR